MIDLLSFFKKMLHEYELQNGQLMFTFCKHGDEFVYTFVNERLLQAVQLQPGDVVDRTLQSPYISHDLSEKLQAVYSRAWSGQTTLYYFIPDTNPGIILVVLLQPLIQDEKVLEVAGRCVPISLQDFEGAEQFVNHYGSFQTLEGE